MVDMLKERRDSGGFPGHDRSTVGDRREVSGVLLHSVDISNPLLPKFELVSQWAVSINEEFINQFSKEKEYGLPFTKMFEGVDKPIGFYKSQIGFLDNIVAPLWPTLTVIFHELEEQG